MEIDADKIYEFAHRLRYTPVNNLPIGMCVDHINKEYDKNKDIYNILFDILFWNTPSFVYNVVKTSLKNCFDYDMTTYHLFEAIIFSDNITINSTKYRNADINRILHPCIDANLRNNFGKVMTILFSKAFDKEDNHFNTSFPKDYNTNLARLLSVTQHAFLHTIREIDAIISGSFAMSMYGFVYRTSMKDFDLLVDYKYLPDDILEIVNEELTYNKIVGKDRLKTEETVKEKFINCYFFGILNERFYNKLEVISAVIDRVAEYDNITKVTFILKYGSVEFDLIFRNNIAYEIFNIPVCNGLGEIIREGQVKAQDINEILFTKRLLGRPKDFQDLINFKPYTRLNNNGKCIVNYE